MRFSFPAPRQDNPVMPMPPGYRRTLFDSTAGTVGLGLLLTVAAAVLARFLALGHP